MRRISKIIEGFDRNPYSIQLSYKSKFFYKSKTGGCISIIFYLIVLFIVGANVFSIIDNKQLIYTFNEIKNDLSTIEINRDWFALELSATDQSNFTFFMNTTDLVQYGLKVFVSIIQDKDGINLNYTRNESVVDGYITEQGSSDQNFTNCLMFPPNFTMQLEGRSDIHFKNGQFPYRRLGMTVMIQNRTLFLEKNITLSSKFYFVNNVTDPKQLFPLYDKKTRLFYIRDGKSLNIDQLQQQTFYFQKLVFRTDEQKFLRFDETSNYNLTNSSIYNEETEKQLISDNSESEGWIIHIKLKRSIYTLYYDRYYKKFATYASQALGIIGFATIIFITYQGYNKWAFTEKQLTPEDQRTGTNLLKYYWESLKSLKKKIPTESSILYSKFEQKLDFFEIECSLGKIQNLQTRIREIETELELKSSFISSETKKQRLMQVKNNNGVNFSLGAPLLMTQQRINPSNKNKKN